MTWKGEGRRRGREMAGERDSGGREGFERERERERERQVEGGKGGIYKAK